MRLAHLFQIQSNIVRSGDNFGLIALRFGLTIDYNPNIIDTERLSRNINC